MACDQASSGVRTHSSYWTLPLLQAITPAALPHRPHAPGTKPRDDAGCAGSELDG